MRYPGASRGRHGIRGAPGPTRRPRTSSCSPSVGQSPYWAATAEMSIPDPHSRPWPATWRRRALSLSRVRGIPEAAGGGKAKCHPLPSSEANDDAERSRPLPTPWEPLIRSRRRRASKGLDLRGSQVPSASRTARGPRRGYAARREPFGAPSGAGCVRPGSARSISGRCKISRNLRKRPECGAAIGPPGRGLGRAGEGGSEEVDGK